MTTIAEDIQATRDYIANNGWYQGHFYDPDGFSACIRGAIQFVTKLDSDRMLVTYIHLTNQIEQMGLGWEFTEYLLGTRLVIQADGKVREPISLFNDTVLKSKEQALEFLDKARIAAEEIA